MIHHLTHRIRFGFAGRHAYMRACAGVVVLILGVTGVGCVTTEKPPAVDPVVTPPSPPPELGRAIVESVRVLTLESRPVEAFAYVTGYLPDGATRIRSADQHREGNLIVIEIITERPAETVGGTALVAFEKRIPLEIVGLRAGEYTIDVNGVRATLALARDNVPSPPES